MHPLKTDSPLIVYLDVKSPYAFVSVKPTLALERELRLEFDWRPYTLDIPSYLGSARKEKGAVVESSGCLLYTSPSPRDGLLSRMPSSA